MGPYSSGGLTGAWLNVDLSGGFGDGRWVQTWVDSNGQSDCDCYKGTPFYPFYAASGVYFFDDPARFVGPETWTGQASYVGPYGNGAAFTFQWGFTLSDGTVIYNPPNLAVPWSSQQQLISAAQWWLP